MANWRLRRIDLSLQKLILLPLNYLEKRVRLVSDRMDLAYPPAYALEHTDRLQHRGKNRSVLLRKEATETVVDLLGNKIALEGKQCQICRVDRYVY